MTILALLQLIQVYDPKHSSFETSLWTRVDKIHDKYTQLQGVFIHQLAGHIQTLLEAATSLFTHGNISHSLRMETSVIDENGDPGKIYK